MIKLSIFSSLFLFIGTVSCWGMGTSNQLATGDDEDAWVPVKMGGKQIQDKYVDFFCVVFKYKILNLFEVFFLLHSVDTTFIAMLGVVPAFIQVKNKIPQAP